MLSEYLAFEETPDCLTLINSPIVQNPGMFVHDAIAKYTVVYDFMSTYFTTLYICWHNTCTMLLLNLCFHRNVI